MNAAATEEPWTILRLINWTRDYLQQKGIDQPRLAAEVLLAHALGCQRMALYTQFEQVPPPDQMAKYREMVKRAADHEPIAYLVGHRDFYSIDFIVTPEVLIPRPETELLAEQAIDFLRPSGEGKRYWDAFTGSGAVAVAVGKNVPAVKILATDLSDKALAVAQQNVQRQGLAERATLAVANVLDLPAGLAELGPFDVITANPPYIADKDMAELPPEVRHEPALALRAGPDGLDVIRPLLQQAPQRLAPGGLLAVEIGFGQASAVWDLVNQIDQYERASFLRDTANIERVLVAYRKA